MQQPDMPIESEGSSVTLILYAIDKNWWKGGEPLLNLVAAAAQFSSFTHVELAIGEAAGENGKMANVLRVFNDAIGVELTERTGYNPSYSYVQIGCSKSAERAMVNWARGQIGKPFSTSGMAWSLIWPRQSDGRSWYCAELVAACLQVGGLMSPESKPGAATPQSLYRLYKNAGAVAANPCTLRREFGLGMQHQFNLLAPQTPFAAPDMRGASVQQNAEVAVCRMTAAPRAFRSTSPPRMAFKQLTSNRVGGGGGAVRAPASTASLSLSLASLSMNGQRGHG